MKTPHQCNRSAGAASSLMAGEWSALTHVSVMTSSSRPCSSMAPWMSEVLLTMERALMLPTRSSVDAQFRNDPACLVLDETYEPAGLGLVQADDPARTGLDS